MTQKMILQIMILMVLRMKALLEQRDDIHP
ncbi:hypothetical protein SJDPG4_09390 [Porphyromonas gingivalis SJD4]|nr:hypothetical protein SJDPG4_09390 [Porphyromonas gingivalis SJD4]